MFLLSIVMNFVLLVRLASAIPSLLFDNFEFDWFLVLKNVAVMNFGDWVWPLAVKLISFAIRFLLIMSCQAGEFAYCGESSSIRLMLFSRTSTCCASMLACSRSFVICFLPEIYWLISCIIVSAFVSAICDSVLSTSALI